MNISHHPVIYHEIQPVKQFIRIIIEFHPNLVLRLAVYLRYSHKNNFFGLLRSMAKQNMKYVTQNDIASRWHQIAYLRRARFRDQVKEVEPVVINHCVRESEVDGGIGNDGVTQASDLQNKNCWIRLFIK